MEPKRKLSKKRIGILGIAVDEGSSADEDYIPHSSAKRTRPSHKISSKKARSLPSKQGTTKDAILRKKPDWSILPPETLSNVFRLACQDNACPTVPRLQRVCRAWRNESRADPLLWRHVDFLGASWMRPTDQLIHSWCTSGLWCRIESLSLRNTIKLTDKSLCSISQSCPFLHHIDLSYTDGFSAAGVALILRRCPVRTLHVEGGKFPNHSNILDIVRVVTTEEGRYACPDSAEACVSGKGEEWALSFRKSEQRWKEIVSPQTLQDYKGIEDLSFSMCPRFTSATMQKICSSSLLGSLRYLNLTSAGGASGQVTLSLKLLQTNCPLLEEVRFNSLGGLFGWTSSSASRTRAEISRDIGFPNLRVCEIAASGVNSLVSGGRFGESQIYDSVLYELIHKSDALWELDIAGCSKITPKGLQEALSPIAPLRTISMGHSGVTRDSVLHWLCSTYRTTVVGIDAAGGGKHITDDSAIVLAKCKGLTVLSLEGSAITDEGAIHLTSSFAGNACLNQLNLNGCRSVSRDLKRKIASQFGMSRT